MAKQLTAEQARQALADIAASLAAQFSDRPSEDRLAQARSHLDTAAMAIGHLYEEAERRQAERTEQIRRIESGEA